MEAATWTAIAILAATSLGSLFYLGARIDALGARLDARIDAQAAEIREFRTDLNARIDGLSARFDEHVRRHAG
jgi:hypothetical protein